MDEGERHLKLIDERCLACSFWMDIHGQPMCCHAAAKLAHLKPGDRCPYFKRDPGRG